MKTVAIVGENFSVHNLSNKRKEPEWQHLWKEATLNRIRSEIDDKNISIPNLSLPLGELLAPAKRKNVIKKIPRPQNAFVLYRKHVQVQYTAINPKANFVSISKMASKKWKNEPEYTKKFFTHLAAVCDIIHNDVFPKYRYNPSATRKKEREKKSQWEISSFLPSMMLDSSKEFGELDNLADMAEFLE